MVKDRLMARFAVLLACVSAIPVIAIAEGLEGTADEDLLPDLYSDPNISTSDGYIGGRESVRVDPFTGVATVTNTDVVIPGNGGLDISLTRIYRSLQRSDWWHSEAELVHGTGWSMHYGRVKIAAQNKMCSDAYDVSTLDNPVYVSPDGSTHLLAIARDTPRNQYGIMYASDDYSVVHCTSNGFYMMSPDGTRRDFSAVTKIDSDSTPYVWHVTKVTDSNGNTLDISYVDQGSLGRVIDEISASDGRLVTFTYGSTHGATRLLEVHAGPRKWTYEYVNNSGQIVLSRVLAPEFMEWNYEYWPYDQQSANGSGSMKTAINPHGGRYTLHYGYELFNSGDDLTENVVVTQKEKKLSSSQILASWTYTYDQDATGDRTTVVGPAGTRVFHHYGLQEATSDNVWRVGTLKKEVFTPNQGPVKTTEFAWGRNIISDENLKRHRGSGFSVPIDTFYAVPYKTGKTVTLLNGGTTTSTYTTDYSSFTSQNWPWPALPQTITHTTQSSEYSGSRVTERRYHFDAAKWILGLYESDHYDGESTIRNGKFYDSNGNLVQAHERGG